MPEFKKKGLFEDVLEIQKEPGLYRKLLVQIDKKNGLISFSNIFPKIYHESMYQEKYQEKKSLPKIIPTGVGLFIELPYRITEIDIKKPEYYSINLEKYLFDIVRLIEALTKKRYDLKKLKKEYDSIKNVDSNGLDKFDFDSIDIFDFIKPTDTKIIASLKKKYAPKKSKKRSKQPMDYFYTFCGIKVWDLIFTNSMTTSDAIDVFLDNFHEEYGNPEDELDSARLIKSHNEIAKKIKNKQLY